MIRALNSHYRRYEGPIRTSRCFAWWPITRTELSTRVFRWRFLPLYLVIFTPLLFREALLYARFVVAPVRVNGMRGLTVSQMGRLMQWDRLTFYSDYLEDRYLWIFLLLATAVLGAPMVARDLRTRAWEIYFSRSIGRLDYFLGKFSAVFFVLFAATFGGALVLYLTTSLLGPDEAFFVQNLGWLVPLAAYAALLSGFLALASLAFSTFSDNGIVLAGAWLGMFFIAFCVSRVLRVVEEGGQFDWIDPKYLFMAASSVIHGHPFASGFPAWISLPILGLLALGSVLVLARFLRRQAEGIG